MQNLPPKNHNNPPSDLDLLKDKIELAWMHLFQEVDAHAELAGNIPLSIVEQFEADFLSDAIKKMQVCERDLEKARVQVKEPFLSGGKFVDAFFGKTQEQLSNAQKTANKVLTDFLQRKAAEERRQREEEAAALERERVAAVAAVQETQAMPHFLRKTEEVAAKIDHAATMQNVAHTAAVAAAAPINTLASAKGTVSSAGLATKWKGEVENRETLDLNKLRPYLNNSFLQTALDKFVNQGGRQLEGAKIYEVTAAKVKKA